jgi:hypothetical protein
MELSLVDFTLELPSGYEMPEINEGGVCLGCDSCDSYDAANDAAGAMAVTHFAETYARNPGGGNEKEGPAAAGCLILSPSCMVDGNGVSPQVRRCSQNSECRSVPCSTKVRGILGPLGLRVQRMKSNTNPLGSASSTLLEARMSLHSQHHNHETFCGVGLAPADVLPFLPSPYCGIPNHLALWLGRARNNQRSAIRKVGTEWAGKERTE